MLTAKVVVLAAVMLVVGAVAAGTSFWVSQAILADRHAGASIGEPQALRAAVASALLPPVCALVGLGVGALVRHTAPAIVVTTTLLLLAPLAFDIDNRWTAAIHNALPVPAWERLVGNPWVLPNTYVATVAGAWLVFALWPAVATLVAAVAVHRREP